MKYHFNLPLHSSSAENFTMEISIIIPAIQNRNVRYGDVKGLVQGHSTGQ